MSETEISILKFEQIGLQERDWFNQLTGHYQMADAVGQMTQVFSLQKLAEIKERKLYHHLKDRPVRPNSRELLQGTWAEFCLYVVGQSVDKVDLDLKNFQAFGEEALTAMNAAGIGYRQLRDLRRLPENTRIALIKAAESEDKDVLLETAEMLLGRAHVEKEKLQADLSESKATIEAKERLLADRNKELIAAKDKLVFIQNVRAHENALRSEIAAKAVEAQSVVKTQLGDGFKQLAETIPEDEDEESARERRYFMAEHIWIVKQALCQLQDEYGLPDDPDELKGVPEWAQDQVSDEALALVYGDEESESDENVPLLSAPPESFENAES